MTLDTIQQLGILKKSKITWENNMQKKKSKEIAVNAWISNQIQNWSIVRQEVLNILVSSRRPFCHVDALYHA